jgi:lipopolysaccharide/colanic/teichoic acid biosynthesis glycosyltransferase
MGVNVEAEHNREQVLSRGEGYPTVRESIISQELESNHQSVQGEDLYEISRRFREFGSDQTASRIFIDGLLGIIALITFLVLYPLVALGIKLTSRGPVLYKQLRTGKNGKQFVCYKFRTMHEINLRRIDGKPIITKKGDKRIFWFGTLLRRTSLDELPQILNVLKGDMSIIGPRPYPVEECSYWNATFDDFYYRYAVKPGITGLAQINGYRGGTLNEEHMRTRLKHDLAYVKKTSLKIDCYILGKTVEKMVMPDDNAH